ncbi:peptidylprolyl isomerase [Williamsia sp. CHRR-6]|nr:peptidylprolyl isomerase [Williamsia sp. CHRR-6]
MATNEQRRQEAKRKLEQRLQTQQQAARRRQIIVISISTVLTLAAVAAVGTVVGIKINNNRYKTCDYTATPAEQNPFGKALTIAPTLTPDKRGQAQQAVDEFNKGKAAQRTSPLPSKRELKKGTVTARLATSQGDFEITLDRSSAACNVAAITSLIRNKYYDNTTCHRMTGGTPEAKLTVLQCGDPTGTGGGAPGWSSPDEFPTGLKIVPQTQQEAASGQPNSVVYPRGTVAIANSYQPGQQGGPASGENSGSAQLFIVIKDSQLPPYYSVVGKVDATGLAAVDKVLAAGLTPRVQYATDQNGAITDVATTPGDGAPKLPLTFTKVSIA